VLYEGLGIRKFQFFIPKNIYSFPVVHTFKFLVIETQDLHPDPDMDPEPIEIKCWIRIRNEPMGIRNIAVFTKIRTRRYGENCFN
jgi:hypothetical protein